VLHLGYLAYYATSREYRFDSGVSARIGAPVFRKRSGWVSDGVGYLGVEKLGIVLLAERSQFLPVEVPTPDGPVFQVLGSERETVAHEAIHVLQEEQYNLLVALPTERALVQRVRGLRRLGRHVDLGIVGPLVVLGLEQRVRYERRPWEHEAARFAAGH
jgi:hypothetical protein